MSSLRLFINFIIKGFCNFWVTFGLLLAYGAACGVATFIENDYGTPSARALIYDTPWFDLLHLLLIFNLIGLLLLSRLWQRKKYASLLFHSSLIMIFIGAGLTRYYGFEGIMHIREGEKTNIVQSQEEFLNIFTKTDNKFSRAFFPLTITPLVQKKFDHRFEIGEGILHLKYKDYMQKEESQILILEASYQGQTQTIQIQKGMSNQMPTLFMIGDKKFAFIWGSRDIALPFYLELKDFQLERYAGSMSPSSYTSDIVLTDKAHQYTQEYSIFMNNVLDYRGYRFFQSSYDMDELGTILSVNQDPGKIPTYIGYMMLALGLLWSFFAKNGRFHRLGKYLKMHHLALCLLTFGLLNTPSYASQTEQNILNLIRSLQQNSKDHAQMFGELIVQDFGGRMKPLDTLASEYIHKITQQDSFLGLNTMQLFLGMLVYPNDFKKVKMIAIANPRLKEVIGVSPNTKFVAFDDLFQDDQYKLFNYLEEANRKKPSQRSKFDNEVINIDERLNAAYLIYTAQSLKIFPDRSKQTDTWYEPKEAISSFPPQDSEQIENLLRIYFQGVEQGLLENNWEGANLALNAIKTIQDKLAPHLLPASNKVQLEILLNHYNIFDDLTLAYLLAGLILFGIVLVQIFRNKPSHIWPNKIIHLIITLFALLHTLGLGIRWYIGDHAPWSNAYESMVYIAWAAAISGVIFFSRSYLALAMSSILAGISLFVAHLGFMNPQIGNLIPVLKSYWLNIHVSIITASYGFLGLCFMLGAISLLLFLFRKSTKPQIDNTILHLHVINEMSMILGLAMLSVGNFLGGVWANESWGRYWGWDPKETWALISIVVYIVVLHARFIPSLNNPFSFACLSVVAFYSILMTYFGVNYYLSGLHSYAAGDPLPIPTFLYFLIGGNLLLILLAAQKRHLSAPTLPL